MTRGATLLLVRPRTEIEFLGWLGQARPGEAIAYHRGFLAADRSSPPNRDLNRLAKRALWAAEHGFVDLVQQRHGAEDTSYLAIARRRTESLSSLIGTVVP
jgi:hypothetical protein